MSINWNSSPDRTVVLVDLIHFLFPFLPSWNHLLFAVLYLVSWIYLGLGPASRAEWIIDRSLPCKDRAPKCSRVICLFKSGGSQLGMTSNFFALGYLKSIFSRFMMGIPQVTDCLKLYADFFYCICVILHYNIGVKYTSSLFPPLPPNDFPIIQSWWERFHNTLESCWIPSS